MLFCAQEHQLNQNTRVQDQAATASRREYFKHHAESIKCSRKLCRRLRSERPVFYPHAFLLSIYC